MLFFVSDLLVYQIFFIFRILEESPKEYSKKESGMQPSTATYYQVLIDERDFPHIVSKEFSVTFMLNFV